VTIFCPDGYVPTREALVRAAQYFFSEQIAATERAPSAGSETKPNNFADAVARAFSRSQVLNTLQRDFRDIANQTEHRLRNFLHQGKLNAYYFDDNGCHSVPRALWATAYANGALVSGTFHSVPPALRATAQVSDPFWGFGPLFLMQSELDELLAKQPVEKRPFPAAKMKEVVAALRELNDLPNRTAQLEALSNMPQFRAYTITHAVFRKAAKQAGPRRAGRKSRR
jgi:hypothetical protein